jgi:hypothetical protein
MSMYKRPLPRVKVCQDKNERVKITEGTYLHGLLNTGPTTYYKYTPAPVYEKETYLKLLKKNCENLSIPFKEPKLPHYERPPERLPNIEPELQYADTVYVKFKILKSGIIRVKIDASIATLHEKYYSKCKRPPVKSVIQAYKSMGFSQGFLDRIKQNYEKKVEQQKRIEKIIDKIFNKEPVKKPKKKKKEEEPVHEEPVEEEEEDEDDDDDVPGDDEGMDVEVEEEEVEEEPQEEEYLSD